MAGVLQCDYRAGAVTHASPGWRERSRHVIDVPDPTFPALRRAIRRAEKMHGTAPKADLYGDGRSGPRIARLLASTDPHDPALLRKRNTY